MQAAVDNLTFEEWWGELAEAVRAWLLRRRVPPHLVDDIVQETGLRLFKMWDEIDAMRSPRGLAFTIASNLLWDERNRRASREVLGDVPEQSCEDVERAGIARLELARVRRAMARLNPQQRAVLLAEIGDADGPLGNPDAVKMMRMRARRRLTALLGSAPVGAFALLDPRKLLKALRSAHRSAATQVPALAFVAACTTIAVIGIPPTQPAFRNTIETVPLTENTVRPPQAHSALATNEAQPRTPSKGGSFIVNRNDPPSRTADRVTVEVGDGTAAHGKASVGIEQIEGFGIKPPACSNHGAGNDIAMTCSTTVGDRRIDAEVVLGVDP